MRLKRTKRKYSIPWKIKSLIFRVIEYLDVPKLLYFLQKFVTGRSRIASLVESSEWQMHKDALKKYETTNLLFEFGAGKSLIQNLYLSNWVKKQFVVDLYPMIDFKLVDSACKNLSKINKLRSKVRIKNLKDLENFGIYYIAPYNATKIHLPDKSIDACVSTNTLEHIPKVNIIEIFFYFVQCCRSRVIDLASDIQNLPHHRGAPMSSYSTTAVIVFSYVLYFNYFSYLYSTSRFHFRKPFFRF